MSISDRYATAVRSSRLVSDPRSTFSDVDVLGAFGLADRALKRHNHPLAVALERMFTGAGSTIEILAELVLLLRGKARRSRMKLTNHQATEIAKACLAWHTDNTCKPCGGHGLMVVPGSHALGTKRCPSCRGDGNISREFDRAMPERWHAIARWLIAGMEHEMGRAGPAAMAKLDKEMDF
jgi:hypothetical protein